jgi:hypothetical protein
MGESSRFCHACRISKDALNGEVHLVLVVIC